MNEAGTEAIRVRVVRIATFAAVVAFAFETSRRAGAAAGRAPEPGMLWAIGILAGLFFVRALGVELTRSSRSTWSRDLLWGVSLGALGTLAARL